MKKACSDLKSTAALVPDGVPGVLLKTGRKQLNVPKNYRPVALTFHMNKIFERVVRQSLLALIEKLGLLPNARRPH